MTDKKFDIDLLRIETINIIQANITNETNIIKLDNDKYSVNITFSFDSGVSVAQKKMRIIFTCGLNVSKIDSTEPVPINARFEISYVFVVDNMIDLEIQTQGQVSEVDAELLSNLTNITYATSRGIIYTRLQGTILQKFILPVLSTNKIMKSLLFNEGSKTEEL